MALSLWIRVVPLLTLVSAAVSCLHAQVIPSNLSVNASMRMECLFATHSVGDAYPPGEESERFGLDFDFKLPVILGEVEVSSAFPVAARLLGYTSVWESSGSISRAPPDQEPLAPPELRLNAKPRFSGWETAALYHLWQGSGHTYSIGVGYRQEYWRLIGEGVGIGNRESQSEDKVLSSGPFVSLRTAMALPGWHARFELLASKFMNRTIDGVVIRPDFSSGYEAKANGGGFLEAQVRGLSQFSQRFLLGLYASYTMQEFSGNFSTKMNERIRGTYDAHLTENRLILGLDITVFF